VKFNSFSYDVTDPLTAENLQRVTADMIAKAGQQLDVQPDTFIVPHAVYEQWLQLCLHDAEAELKHATKLSTRVILSGRYGKRRRQIVDGVAAARLQRRREAVAQLPQLHDDVVKARAALLDFKKPFHYVEVTTQ
jgi:hypothetical protein